MYTCYEWSGFIASLSKKLRNDRKDNGSGTPGGGTLGGGMLGGGTLGGRSEVALTIKSGSL